VGEADATGDVSGLGESSVGLDSGLGEELSVAVNVSDGNAIEGETEGLG
jgi:hypothetical protein